jgi:TM2 domain-containing membrane protein YozV
VAKRLWLSILLAILVWGVGHIYLGFIIRGIVILVIGLILAFVMPWFIPYSYIWAIVTGYKIWQIWDAYKYYKKLNLGQTQVKI